MKTPLRILLPGLILLASVGCDRMMHSVRKTCYFPTEVGLTLVYEDPSQPHSLENRFQLRVSATKETPEGTLVRTTFTTLQGQMDSLSLVKDGGKRLLLEGNRTLMVVPEGFPDRVSHWEAPGSTAHVIGRAAANLPGLVLPKDFDRMGVWVQLDFPEGPSRRIFYLPGIGEAETQVLREGVWVSTNRLISRGFTDAPPTPKS